MNEINYQKFSVLYIDDVIAVVYKPFGMLSVPAGNGRGGRTALSSLEDYMRKTGRFSGHHQPAAVHRLDRDTSGVLMFALTKPMQQKIMDNWQKMVTARTYVALAENPGRQNKALPAEGTINSPLAFNAYHQTYVPRDLSRLSPKEKKEMVSAVTHYTVLKTGKNHTLFELNLETGRKNQIRAHLSSIGYPIAGDENYRCRTNPFNRLCLHARLLEFVHPVTKEKMRFEVSAPKEWEKIQGAGQK
ncbi:MAG: RluA family pseudouridine synthase [Treponema sp.]|nr:RluA family pseudouridine synthase [Treponema sp.]